MLNLPSLVGIEDTNLRKLIINLILEIYLYQAESERIALANELLQQGNSMSEIARKTGINRSTLYIEI